ncbi:MAG TPA: hypothetical protein VNA57_08075 [Acidimicrobiales bacterium]|nr:hypothetical protein [Acidimicrobiales bacterium]
MLTAIMFVSCTEASTSGENDGAIADPPASRLPPGDAVSSQISEEGVGNTYTASVLPGTIMVETMDLFDVREPATLKEVTLLKSDPAIEVLAAYVSFWVRGGRMVGMYPGNYCIRAWTPESAVGVVPAKDFPLQPKDQIAVTMLLRARTAGDSSVSGLRIVYEQKGRLYQQTSESSKVVVHAREREEDLVAGEKCNPDRPDSYFPSQKESS